MNIRVDSQCYGPCLAMGFITRHWKCVWLGGDSSEKAMQSVLVPFNYRPNINHLDGARTETWHSDKYDRCIYL